MKRMVIAAVAMLGYVACSSEREIQVHVENLTLVKVDTIDRGDDQQLLMTWQSPRKVNFYSFEKVGVFVPVGASMRALVRR